MVSHEELIAPLTFNLYCDTHGLVHLVHMKKKHKNIYVHVYYITKIEQGNEQHTERLHNLMKHLNTQRIKRSQ